MKYDTKCRDMLDAWLGRLPIWLPLLLAGVPLAVLANRYIQLPVSWYLWFLLGASTYAFSRYVRCVSRPGELAPISKMVGESCLLIASGFFLAMAGLPFCAMSPAIAGLPTSAFTTASLVLAIYSTTYRLAWRWEAEACRRMWLSLRPRRSRPA